MSSKEVRRHIDLKSIEEYTIVMIYIEISIQQIAGDCIFSSFYFQFIK